MVKPGERVGAIFDLNEDDLLFLGYGVYEGVAVPPYTAKGNPHYYYQTNTPNPRIRLDNGDVVWACECVSWFAEKEVQLLVRKYKTCGRTIKNVRIDDMRLLQNFENNLDRMW